MALKLNLPSLKGVGPGSSAAKAVGGVKIPKAVNPKAMFSPPKVAKTQQVSPYDQFTLKDPYDPATISQQAQTGYNSDVANDTKLASMGYPTSSAIGADYAARGAQSNSIYQDLAAHLAGVNVATVAQGNAGSAVLEQQNAAAQATAPNIAGAPVSASPIPTSAVQAVLGAQTAASGNYGGALQSAALSAGTQANQKALDAGGVAQQDNTNSIQRTLASLLSGVPSESAREGTMNDANQKVDAANIQTKFSVYQNLVNQQQYAQTLGSKTAMAAADNALKQWTTQQSNATKVKLGISTNQTRAAIAGSNNATKTAIANSGNRTKAQIAKDNAAARVTAAKTSAAAKVAAAKTSAAAKTGAAKTSKGYQVTILMPATQEVDPNTGKIKLIPAKRVSKPINAAVWQRYVASGPLNKRKKSILGIPDDAQVQKATAKS